MIKSPCLRSYRTLKTQSGLIYVVVIQYFYFPNLKFNFVLTKQFLYFLGKRETLKISLYS